MKDEPTKKDDDSPDPLEQARASLLAVRQYQQDWQDHGVGRVYLHFDDVECSWLEEWTGSDA